MPTPLFWTPQRLSHIKDLFDHGASKQDVADAMGVPLGALTSAMCKHGIRRGDSKSLNATAVAALLGVKITNVAAWIHRYGLYAVNASTTKRALYAVDWLDLMAWLEQPEHFMMYDPAGVKEATLREHLTALHREHGGWVKASDVAARHHITRQAVLRWARRRNVPMVVYGATWLRSVDADAYVPLSLTPPDAPRGFQRWSQNDLDTLEAMWTTHSVEAIAAALQRRVTQVYAMAWHRGLRRGYNNDARRRPRVTRQKAKWRWRKKIAQLRQRTAKRVRLIIGHIAA